MSFADPFTFGCVQYVLVTDGPNQQVPVPMPGDSGQWTHIPHGGNVWESAGALHMTWAPTIQVPASSWAAFKSLCRQFASLTVPADFGGPYNARLAQMSLRYIPSDDVYEGQVQWEWA